MHVFSLEQIKELADGQRQSEPGLQHHLSPLEPTRSPSTAVKYTMSDILRHFTATLTHSASLEDMLHKFARTAMQAIDADLCLIMLTEAPQKLRIVTCIPDLSDKEVVIQPVTIAPALLERLRTATQQSQVLRLSSQEQDALNPLKNVEYAELCVIPLMLGNDCLGTVNCYTSTTLHATDENQLLLCVLASQAALAIGHYQRVKREEREQQQGYIYSFMNDLLHTVATCTDAALQRRVCTLGYDLAAPHVVALLQLQPAIGKKLATEELRRSHAQHFDKEMTGRIEQRYPGSLIALIDEQLVCLLCLDPDLSLDAVNQWFEELAYQLYDEQQVIIFVGVCMPCDNTISENRRGYAEAQEALQVVQWLKQRGGSIAFNALGVYRYLYRFAHENALRDQYQDQIAALAEYDRLRHTNLLHTLESYLECGTNIAEASHLLHIHRNTMQQRLERIQALCTLDLKQQTNWLPLQVALKVHRLASPDEHIP